MLSLGISKSKLTLGLDGNNVLWEIAIKLSGPSVSDQFISSFQNYVMKTTKILQQNLNT